MQHQDRKRSSFRNGLVLLGLILTIAMISVCAVASYLFWRLSASDLEGFTLGNTCPSEEPEKLEEMLQFELPLSARNVYSFCGGMQGWIIYSRFDIAAEDLPLLLDKLWLKPQFRTEAELQNIQYFEEEGLLDKIDSYLYSLETGSDFSQELLIDESESEQYRIFLHMSGG
jgi:hypothetical protein